MAESVLQLKCVFTPVTRTTIRTVVVLVFIVVLTVVAADRGYDGTAIASILLAAGALLRVASLNSGQAAPTGHRGAADAGLLPVARDVGDVLDSK